MNVVDINEYQPHKLSELICLKCLNRSIHVRPSDVRLKDLECDCGQAGFLIETGEEYEGNAT